MGRVVIFSFSCARACVRARFSFFFSFFLNYQATGSLKNDRQRDSIPPPPPGKPGDLSLSLLELALCLFFENHGRSQQVD